MQVRHPSPQLKTLSPSLDYTSSELDHLLLGSLDGYGFQNVIVREGIYSTICIMSFETGAINQIPDGNLRFFNTLSTSACDVWVGCWTS